MIVLHVAVAVAVAVALAVAVVVDVAVVMLHKWTPAVRCFLLLHN